MKLQRNIERSHYEHECSKLKTQLNKTVIELMNRKTNFNKKLKALQEQKMYKMNITSKFYLRNVICIS